jgi:hypothetical protein
MLVLLDLRKKLRQCSTVLLASRSTCTTFPHPSDFTGKTLELDLGSRANLPWSAPDEQLKRSFQPNERIEKTAECVALAALRARDKLTVFGRAEELSGADWLVSRNSRKNTPVFRVEVSGIDVPVGNSDAPARLRKKVQQIRDGRVRGHRPLPGLAAVVSISVRGLLTEMVPLD